MWRGSSGQPGRVGKGFLWAVLAAVSVGCGGATGPKAPQFKGDTIPITGIVTLDGNPLADASVTFNFDGTPPVGFISAGGKSDSSGKYVARSAGGKEGIPIGRYKVTVSCLVTKNGTPFREDPASGMDAEQLKLAGGLKEMVPVKYTDIAKTPLTIEITADQKEANLGLKSK